MDLIDQTSQLVRPSMQGYYADMLHTLMDQPDFPPFLAISVPVLIQTLNNHTPRVDSTTLADEFAGFIMVHFMDNSRIVEPGEESSPRTMREVAEVYAAFYGAFIRQFGHLLEPFGDREAGDYPGRVGS